MWYSGMATGMLGGMYTPKEDTIDLEAFCRRNGVSILRTRVASLDRQARQLRRLAFELKHFIDSRFMARHRMP